MIDIIDSTWTKIRIVWWGWLIQSLTTHTSIRAMQPSWYIHLLLTSVTSLSLKVGGHILTMCRVQKLKLHNVGGHVLSMCRFQKLHHVGGHMLKACGVHKARNVGGHILSGVRCLYTLQEFKFQGAKSCDGVALSRYSQSKWFEFKVFFRQRNRCLYSSVTQGQTWNGRLVVRISVGGALVQQF